MVKGGLVLIWELDMNLEPTLVCVCMNISNSEKDLNVWRKYLSTLFRYMFFYLVCTMYEPLTCTFSFVIFQSKFELAT